MPSAKSNPMPTRAHLAEWRSAIAQAESAQSGEELASVATRVSEFADSSTMAGQLALAIQSRADHLDLPCSSMSPTDCVDYLTRRYRPEQRGSRPLQRWVDPETELGEQRDLFRSNPGHPPLRNPRVMPDPGACAWLGSLLEWKWAQRKDDVLWEPEGPWLFLWSPKLKAVVSVPAVPSGAMGRRPKVSRRDGGAKMFERFMARPAENTWSIRVPKTPIKRLGDAVHIVYRSDKWDPPNEVDYIHDFGKGVRLYCGPDLRRPEVFLCFGGRMTATERGLVY
jgi:hypothetical protein